MHPSTAVARPGKSGHAESNISARTQSDRLTSRRKLLIALGLGMLSAPLASLAQQPGRMRRVGVIQNGTVAI